MQYQFKFDGGQWWVRCVAGTIITEWNAITEEQMRVLMFEATEVQ